MVSSVKSRPNHYETLGLTPKAKDDDIEEAYADFVARIRSSPRMHPRQVVELSRGILAAYKTLRDPIKRREYDASLGLTPKPKRQRKATPFIAATPEGPAQPGAGAQISEASSDAVKPRADETSPASAPKPESQPPPEGPAERVGPFIAATLRGNEPQPEPQHRPEALAEPGPDPHIVGNDEVQGAENAGLAPDADERPSDSAEGGWGDDGTEDGSLALEASERASERKRVAVGLGAFVAVVAVLAVLISPWSGNRAPAPPARTAATGEPTATPSQAPPQQTLSVDGGAPQLADETDASTSASADADSILTDPSTTNNAAADLSATNGADETQPVAEREPGTIASSADPLAPAPPGAGTNSADPLAPSPPAAGAQSPPAAVAPPVAGRAPATPPAPTVNRSRPARWISGGLAKADNAGGWFEGTVTVQFTVRPNGQVTGCRASAGSGNPALDARTCGLLEQRLLFSPALDSQGRPITSQMRGTYTWGRNQRQKRRR